MRVIGGRIGFEIEGMHAGDGGTWNFYGLLTAGKRERTVGEGKKPAGKHTFSGKGGKEARLYFGTEAGKNMRIGADFALDAGGGNLQHIGVVDGVGFIQDGIDAAVHFSQSSMEIPSG